MAKKSEKVIKRNSAIRRNFKRGNLRKGFSLMSETIRRPSQTAEAWESAIDGVASIDTDNIPEAYGRWEIFPKPADLVSPKLIDMANIDVGLSDTNYLYRHRSKVVARAYNPDDPNVSGRRKEYNYSGQELLEKNLENLLDGLKAGLAEYTPARPTTVQKPDNAD